MFPTCGASIVRGKTFARVEGRPHDEHAREDLVRDAARVASAAPAVGVPSGAPVDVGDGDPLRCDVEELARIRGRPLR